MSDDKHDINELEQKIWSRDYETAIVALRELIFGLLTTHPEAPFVLARALRHPESRIRAVAAMGFQRKAIPDVLPDLLEVLPSESDPIAQSYIARALYEVVSVAPDKSLCLPAIPILLKWLDMLHVSSTFPIYLIIGLAQDISQIPHLLADLRSDEWDFQKGASRALSYMHHPDVVSGLIEALHDENPHTRMFAAGALGNLRDSEGTAALIEALNDPDQYVRSAAAQHLRSLKDPALLPVLSSLLEDDYGGVQATARFALEELDTPEARAALEAWKHKNDRKDQ